jgi:hypothetical protein
MASIATLALKALVNFRLLFISQIYTFFVLTRCPKIGVHYNINWKTER